MFSDVSCPRHVDTEQWQGCSTGRIIINIIITDMFDGRFTISWQSFVVSGSEIIILDCGRQSTNWSVIWTTGGAPSRRQYFGGNVDNWGYFVGFSTSTRLMWWIHWNILVWLSFPRQKFRQFVASLTPMHSRARRAVEWHAEDCIWCRLWSIQVVFQILDISSR